MSLKILIDADKLAKEFKEFADEVKKDIIAGVATLAASTDAKVKEMAQEELKSSRDQFLDNIKYEEIVPGVHVITVLEDAVWIEEGLPNNFDLKPGLLNSPNAKTSKKGTKYLPVPFKHSKVPSKVAPSSKKIIDEIRTKLKKEGVPFKKIEFNADGSPRVGKLHTFSWGGDIPGKGNTPALERVTIYQTPSKDGSIRRDIMTFRTVSSGPSSQNKWKHPGLEGKKFLDRAADWAMNEWETKILPEISKKWDMK